jgi:nitrogen fixation/metabolism regulation signal transduction histidine kinase
VAVFDDITRLLAAQRQAAWGEVARRLAHEIKNPLTPIQLSAERLQQRLRPRLEEADAEMLARLTSNIVAQVTALKGMVDAFSQYARMPETRLETLELDALAREVLGLYEATGVRIALDVVPGTPAVCGDPAKLRQVIHNLLRNAEDAVAGVSSPRLTVSVEPVGERVALRVADNGPGFPPELMGRAFEPYVTTKPGGTGLGLAIVHKIVEEHRGSVRVENLPGAGARVSILLPAAAAAAPRDALLRAANA